jgi:hypothetical protein
MSLTFCFAFAKDVRTGGGRAVFMTGINVYKRFNKLVNGWKLGDKKLSSDGEGALFNGECNVGIIFNRSLYGSCFWADSTESFHKQVKIFFEHEVSLIVAVVVCSFVAGVGACEKSEVEFVVSQKGHGHLRRSLCIELLEDLVVLLKDAVGFFYDVLLANHLMIMVSSATAVVAELFVGAAGNFVAAFKTSFFVS